MNKEKLKEKFFNHAKDYNLEIPENNLKLHHSYRVMDISEKLASELNLSKENIELATLIGLLHDYSRFEQWNTYHTHNDYISIDHGDLAVKILFEDNKIKEFTKKEKNYKKIYNAIKYHNKLKIPFLMNKENKTFCKIIRDADKLDIFYIIANRKNDEGKDIISKKVKKYFYKHKTIPHKYIKNKNNKVLQMLCLVYDFYYDSSYNYIKEKDYINKMYKNIENKEMFKEYFEYINNYIDKKIKSNSSK